MSQTQEQQHFTSVKVAADWHELMILQHIMQPSIVRANKQLCQQAKITDITQNHSDMPVATRMPYSLDNDIVAIHAMHSKTV